MESEETAVEPTAFRFQHTYRHLYTGLTQHLYAPALHFGKGVYTPYHHTGHPFLDNQFGTRRRLAVMGTGLQAHIHGGCGQERLILLTYRRKGIYLSMPLATPHVIAFAYDTATGHNHRTHHWVGAGSVKAATCQLQTPPHIPFIFLSL